MLLGLLILVDTCPIGCTGCNTTPTGSQTCTGCDQGRFLQWKQNSTVQRCTLCHVGCVDCSVNRFTCTSCVSQQYYSTPSSNCWSCRNAHDDKGTCIECLSTTNCILCGNDSYMADTNNAINATHNETLCYYCVQNCTRCEDATYCTECDSGFYFDNNTCP